MPRANVAFGLKTLFRTIFLYIIIEVGFLLIIIRYLFSPLRFIITYDEDDIIGNRSGGIMPYHAVSDNHVSLFWLGTNTYAQRTLLVLVDFLYAITDHDLHYNDGHVYALKSRNPRQTRDKYVFGY